MQLEYPIYILTAKYIDIPMNFAVGTSATCINSSVIIYYMCSYIIQVCTGYLNRKIKNKPCPSDFYYYFSRQNLLYMVYARYCYYLLYLLLYLCGGCNIHIWAVSRLNCAYPTGQWQVGQCFFSLDIFFPPAIDCPDDW